jgi:glyoxylase-like metal-dependent hydrolase (beta-lactamase superfamily II)
MLRPGRAVLEKRFKRALPAPFVACAAIALCACAGSPAVEPRDKQAGRLQVEMFKGDFATVNSFIFSNGRSIVVMDVQRKREEARKLVEVVKAKGLPVTHVLITHGHTDHFTGMPLFRDEFPDARIVVANDDIKRDIKVYAIYMDSGGETGAEPALEPALRPKTRDNPNGFDYENSISVLAGGTLTLDGGGTLELTTDYRPAEADHMTTVYNRDLNALFLSDFGYNKVHHWQGDDITREDIANWRAELLRLKAKYADRNPTVYPGHGDTADMRLFDTMVEYIDNYTRITAEAKSRKEAMSRMIALYPDYAEADFFLKYSIENHVKEHRNGE